MRKTLKSMMSLILVLSMLMSIAPSVFASSSEMSGTIGLADEEVDVSEELAAQLVTEMFGTPLSEGVPTDTGYQYKVSTAAFDDLINAVEDEAAVETNELPEDYVDDSNEYLYEILEVIENVSLFATPQEATTKVEVVFVIDSTGSMGGEITAVKNNAVDFAQYLASNDISLRLGLIDYRDITADGNDSTIVHSSDYSYWMNVTEFISALTNVSVNGGGDFNETPIDGLGHLTEGTFSWSSDAYKFAILITDAGYKKNNNHGISDMNDMIQRLSAADIQVSTITPSDQYATYGNLAGFTGGIQANINGDFGTILREYAEVVLGGAQPTQDYTVRVVEETTGLPVKGAQVSWSGGSASTTDTNGLTVVTTRNNPIRSVVVSKAGYITKNLATLDLVSKSSVTVELTVIETTEPETLPEGDSDPVLTPSMFQNPKDGSGSANGPYIEILGKKINLFDKLAFAVDFNPFYAGKLSISHDKEEKNIE